MTSIGLFTKKPAKVYRDRREHENDAALAATEEPLTPIAW
jgi:hypothetical protein